MRRVDGLIATLLLIGLVALVVRLREPSDRLSGVARVIDGDTIVIDGRHVRLVGLDAPELAQRCGEDARPSPCGIVARDAMVSLTRGAAVTCEIHGRDPYHRDLGRCAVGPDDLGAAMVSRGLAVAYGRYAAEERAARAAGLGLWSGPFVRPAEWRKTHPRPAG